MKRRTAIAAAAMTLALMLTAVGCSPKVEVQTGTKILCPYGHVFTDGVRTVTVPADEAGNFQVVTVARACELHARLERLYQEAQNALAAGDMAAAKAKLTEVVAGDASFGRAAAQLDTIGKGGKPDPDSGTGGTQTGTTPSKPGDTSTGNPAESLLRWAPDSLTGFAARKPTVDPLSIARDYTPQSGSEVVTLVIAAEQFSSNAMAKEGLSAQVERPYSSSSSSLEVNGHTVYFGTDGRRFGVMGFVDGSVMVVIEASGKAGTSPADLKPALEDIVEQLPK